MMILYCLIVSIFPAKHILYMERQVHYIHIHMDLHLGIISLAALPVLLYRGYSVSFT